MQELKPKYYKLKLKGVEFDVIDIIQALELNFELGNVLKYIARAGKKDKETRTKDLLKAKEYIERELEKEKQPLCQYILVKNI